MPNQTHKRSIEQRRALMAECKRRMEAGEKIKDICAALQIPKSTFYRWSKTEGFRRGDVDPAHPTARTRSPAGPSASTSSGLYMRGGANARPARSGRKAQLTPEEIAHFRANPAEAHLEAQRANGRGNYARVDAIAKVMKQEKSRDNQMLKLRELAQKDPNYDWGRYEHECMERWEDDELHARVMFRVVHDLDHSVKEPPFSQRPEQEWIDKYLAVSGLPIHEARARFYDTPNVPDMPGPWACFAEDVTTPR